MKTLVRMLAVIAAVLALIVGALAAYVALVFDPNDYREQLAEQVARHTGRALTIDGEIGLSLFPWLGAELTDVSLADAPGFGDEPFARIARAHARVRLWPLLRGEVEVDRVLLDGLALRLERDADGRNNWDDLLARSEAGAPQPARPSSGTADVLGGVAALAVSGVEVEAATLSWHDRQRGTQQRFDDIRLRTGEIRPGAAFPLELGLDLESSAPAVSARIELTGEVTLAADWSQLDVEPLALRVRGQGEDWPGGEGVVELDAVVRHEFDTGTLTLSQMAVRGFGVEARSDVTVHTAGEDGPRYAGTLDVAEFSPRELLAALGQPVDTADPQALQAARMQARFEGSAAALAVEPFELRIDDSTLAGKLGVSDLTRGALNFDLALDALDLDRYLPPQSEQAPVATPGAGAAATAEPGALRTLDLDGRLRVGRLQASGLRIDALAVDARAADGVLRLGPLAATLYDGRYKGNVVVDARREPMVVTMDEALEGVQIGPLLRDLRGEDARLTGKAELRAKLQARGNDADAVKRSLAGDVAFRFSDGAVTGINIAQMLREAGARLKGEAAPEASGPNQTDFTELTGTLRIADGVVRNDDLHASSPLLRVAGSGSADLVAEELDYRIRASVVGTLTGQGGRPLEELRGVTVPIRVSGRFDAPAYALDLDALVTETARQQARERIEEKLQEKLPEGLQEDLRRGLRGLLR